MSIEYGNLYHNTKGFGIILKKNQDVNNYLFYLSIFNYRLFWFFIKNTSSEYGGGYYVFTKSYISPFPLPEKPNDSTIIIDRANQMLSLNKDFQEQSQKFLTLLKSDFNIEKTTTKIENWYKLSWS